MPTSSVWPSPPGLQGPHRPPFPHFLGKHRNRCVPGKAHPPEKSTSPGPLKKIKKKIMGIESLSLPCSILLNSLPSPSGLPHGKVRTLAPVESANSFRNEPELVQTLFVSDHHLDQDLFTPHPAQARSARCGQSWSRKGPGLPVSRKISSGSEREPQRQEKGTRDPPS